MASITRGLVWANDQSVIWKFILYYEPFICIYEVIISYLLSICYELSVSISAEKAPYTASLAMTTCRHPGRNRLSFQSYLSKLQVMILKTWFVESEASRHSAQQLFKRSIIHLWHTVWSTVICFISWTDHYLIGMSDIERFISQYCPAQISWSSLCSNTYHTPLNDKVIVNRNF